MDNKIDEHAEPSIMNDQGRDQNIPGKTYTREEYDKAKKSVRGQVIKILSITCAVAVVLAFLTFMLIRSRLQ